MAKYKILKKFTDKYDKTIEYKVGKVEEFSDKRAKEILSVGKLIEPYVEPIEHTGDEETFTDETTEEVVEEKKPRKKK